MMVLSGVFSGPACAENAPVSSEEYEVYSTILERHGAECPNAEKFVIRENTVTYRELDKDAVEYIENELAFDPAAADASKLDPALVDDYNGKNRSVSVLENNFRVMRYILMIKEDVFEEIFSDYSPGGGWDKFNKMFPNSTGTIEFSRVGFDPDHTTAFVYMGNQRDWLVGAGYYFILKKDASSGKWFISGQALAYIS